MEFCSKDAIAYIANRHQQPDRERDGDRHERHALPAFVRSGARFVGGLVGRYRVGCIRWCPNRIHLSFQISAVGRECSRVTSAV
jgi:hypothetical protein